VKVLLRTALSETSGYGRDGIELATTLDEMGADTYIEPFATRPGLPRRVTDILAKSVPKSCDLLITHTDPQTAAISPLQAHHAHHRASVLWTMWETPWWPAPGSPAPAERAAALGWLTLLPHAMSQHDMIAAYDNTTSEAITQGLQASLLDMLDPQSAPDRLPEILHPEDTPFPFPDPTLPARLRSTHTIPQPALHPSLRGILPDLSHTALSAALDASSLLHARTVTVQGGLTAPTPLTSLRQPALWPSSTAGWSSSNPLAILHASDMNDRKNPAALIEAVAQLRAANVFVSLTLKGSGYDAGLIQQLHPSARHTWLEHIPQLLRRPELTRLMLDHHAGAYPSRGEGKNLPAMELSSLGRPCVLTKIGGHLMWASESSAYMIPVETSHALRMVRVSVTDIADAILKMYNHPDEAREKGLLAAATIPTACSWERATHRLLDKLRSRGANL
jgi:glycosyltransferase involved in cell wall biosynthesis